MTDIEGDSSEYEIFESSIKRLTDPIGSSFEIGIRRGMGSKKIIDAYRKYHPYLNEHIHIGLDPYGELPYNFSEENKSNTNHDYTNLMKREMIINFSRKYREFNFVNLDTSSLKDLKMGIQFTPKKKIMINLKLYILMDCTI